MNKFCDGFNSNVNHCLFSWTVFCAVDVGPASMLVGNLVAGKRIAQATGRELGVVEDQDLIRKVLLHRTCDWKTDSYKSNCCLSVCCQENRALVKLTSRSFIVGILYYYYHLFFTTLIFNLCFQPMCRTCKYTPVTTN